MSSDLRTSASSQIEDREFISIIGSRYGAGTSEIESAGEHRTPVEERPSLGSPVGHMTRPLHAAASGGVPTTSRPNQQPEPLIETIPGLRQQSSTHSGRGQLNRNGYAVEAVDIPLPRPPRRRTWPAEKCGATLTARSDE